MSAPDSTVPSVVPTLLTGERHSLGVWADVLPPPVSGGYDPTFPPGAILELDETDGLGVSQRAQLLDTTMSTSRVTSPAAAAFFVAGARYRLVLTCAASGDCRGEVRRDGQPLTNLQLTIAGRVGSVGLRSFGIDARFHHLMVYAPGP